MRTWAEELEISLEKEEQIVRSLLEQARLKTPALQVGNITALGEIVNREQPLVLRLQSVWDSRKALLAANGIAGQTLRDVIGQVPSAGQALSRRRESLYAAALELRHTNERNHALASSRFEQYDHLVESMRKKQTLYTSQGAASGKQSPGHGLIDQKI